ncbi:hypothetical protein D3C71_1829350 [compost metagenome]
MAGIMAMVVIMAVATMEVEIMVEQEPCLNSLRLHRQQHRYLPLRQMYLLEAEVRGMTVVMQHKALIKRLAM